MDTITLDKLKVGARAEIYAIDTKSGLRRRLMELGFITGGKIECLFSSAKSAIRAYQVMGSVLALRQEDAKKIQVCGVIE